MIYQLVRSCGLSVSLYAYRQVLCSIFKLDLNKIIYNFTDTSIGDKTNNTGTLSVVSFLIISDNDLEFEIIEYSKF